MAQRLVNGESVSALHDELGISRRVLYRWGDVYRKEGAAGLRLTGRLTGVEGAPRDGNTQESARRIAELERKIDQQALDLDFLTRAFKRVKESRQKNAGTGATASTEKSEAMQREGFEASHACQIARVSRAGFYRHYEQHEPRQADVAFRNLIQKVALENRFNGYRRVTRQNCNTAAPW